MVGDEIFNELGRGALTTKYTKGTKQCGRVGPAGCRASSHALRATAGHVGVRPTGGDAPPSLDDPDADAFGREVDAGAGVFFPGDGIEFSADAEERESFEVFFLLAGWPLG